MSEWENEKTIIATKPLMKEDKTKAVYPTLIFLSGKMTGNIVRLIDKKTTFGRGSEANIVIDEPTVSRIHAQIERVENGFVLIDNKSTNGTFINEEKVIRKALNEGDKVRLGKLQIMKFTFQDEVEENFQKYLYDSATKDFLTQINNKRYFIDRMKSELMYAQRHKTIFSVIMFDVDHFKAINDTYGHPTGDFVLKAIAETVKNAIRVEDYFARYGGEEFVLLLRGIDEQQALTFSERIRIAVEDQHLVHEGKTLKVTISLGLATQTYDTYPDYEAMIEIADKYLYQAKNSGRNKVCCKLQSG